MSFALFLLRALIGALFIGHGAQKLFGWFGGHGPEGTGRFFESIGIKPGQPMAQAAGVAEFGGGAMVAAGLGTPAAQAALTGVMATAGYTVHRPNGVWVDKGGFEYNLVLSTALLTITAAGPGALSLDAARGRDQWGLGWALAGAAAGIGGAAALQAYTKAAEQPSPSGPEAQEAPAGAPSSDGAEASTPAGTAA